MYSHSGATLSKMLECLANFIAKCKLNEFAIGFCHSKKMYNVTIFFVIGPMSDQNYFCLPNLVGHCPMSDSNLQPCLLNNKHFYFSCISLNTACKFKCYISNSKLVLSKCNDLYFTAIAFIAFTLHEIKQCPVFFGKCTRYN
jgi:hypothetical protein